ncbi:MAG: M4 family metallopeptidase, partial [Chitinophagales bacterium]
MSKFNKPIFFICLLISTLLNAQNPNSDFFRIATSNSTYNWIEIRPELQLSLEEFLAQKTTLGLSPDDGFLLLKTQTDELGKTHYRYQQTYKNIPIANAQFLVHLSEKGFVETANGHLVRNLQRNASPAFSDLGALNAALNYIGAEEYAWQNDAYQKLLKQVKKDPNASFYPKGKLEWASSDFTDNNPQSYRLTYQLQVYATQPLQHVKLYIDAQNRKIINELTQLYDMNSLATGEITYDACTDIVEFHTQYDGEEYLLNNSLGSGISTFEKGSFYFKEIDDTDNHWNNDKTAVDIHWAMEQTYFYFLNEHSLANLGGDINDEVVGIAHASNNCTAYWNGYWARFGDGGNNCNSVTSPDIVAHELSHRVIQHSADLIYKKEPGALNESFSDIFGTLVHFEVDPECANWVIGEEVNTNGFRDMSDSKAFNDPDTYQGTFWKSTNCNPSFSNDFCGVHTNSGVQNHWFYLLAEGGNGINDNGYAYDITGIGKEKAGEIAYRNLTIYLTPTSDYVAARNGSLLAAIDLNGPASVEVQAVIDAWCAVGVGNTNCSILEATLILESPNGGE